MSSVESLMSANKMVTCLRSPSSAEPADGKVFPRGNLTWQACHEYIKSMGEGHDNLHHPVVPRAGGLSGRSRKSSRTQNMGNSVRPWSYSWVTP
jgi:hypothetical protein